MIRVWALGWWHLGTISGQGSWLDLWASITNAEPAVTNSASFLCWGCCGAVEVGARRRGGAVSLDVEGLTQSCSALSSINNHHSKSQLGLQEAGIRDQGHLHNGVKFTPELILLKEGFARPQATQIRLQEESFGVPLLAFRKHSNGLLYLWCVYWARPASASEQHCHPSWGKITSPKGQHTVQYSLSKTIHPSTESRPPLHDQRLTLHDFSRVLAVSQLERERSRGAGRARSAVPCLRSSSGSSWRTQRLPILPLAERDSPFIRSSLKIDQQEGSSTLESSRPLLRSQICDLPLSDFRLETYLIFLRFSFFIAKWGQ